MLISLSFRFEKATAYHPVTSPINEALGNGGKKLLCVLLPIGYPDEVPRVPQGQAGKVTWTGF
jgi:hypothetical protein